MVVSREFLTGVIEGFYGRQWSTDTRLSYAEYLRNSGLNSYIYCPKNDPYLRSRWQEHWPAVRWQELRQLSSIYHQHEIAWGVGLSPVELYRDYGEVQRVQLRKKIERLSELNLSLLAILFDDMPGDMDSLATRQAEIVVDVCNWAPGVRVLACPTYYSFDPVLERYFGSMPNNYWSQLGRELPDSVDIFWTGSSVCSQQITVGDIKDITEHLARPVTLWDNYPVNDGAIRSNFLYLSTLADRPKSLRPLLSGHFCNPMNQGVLSLPALGGLSELYGNGGLDEVTLSHILGIPTWEKLQRDKHLFEEEGLSGIGPQRCAELALEYSALPGRAASEVAQWLNGEYRFDPACLTE